MSRRRLMKTAEAAEYLTVTAAALRAWRLRGGGPPWIKLGGAVRYDEGVLNDWLDGQTTQTPPPLRGRR
ncbi:Helix-turn-helix domain-containing protein [Jiangella alkaliphila]|uniref:Helix-turn-helix domain-containing protein n=2 Tax=Jiangella alkaliphila TaxID=419479 RepID=A0A1H2LN88_9ACTN|nr:Helix-turn-helix domain-containing protein [Jiangella alkaliphila]